VADYAVMTARHMGYGPKFLTMLKIAGQLHDFGKIGIRENILDKDGDLNEHEQYVMNEHPALGAQILQRFKPFSEIVPGIRNHHERYDGQGYPDGLAGDKIPMVGRIIAVADAFDAMTTTRPYRTRLNLSEALAELEKYSGTQFDPAVVQAFIAAFNRRRSEANG
jgi:HD-GYP domain-containing protein (c-di-GMP phosphodiesterase class II)